MARGAKRVRESSGVTRRASRPPDRREDNEAASNDDVGAAHLCLGEVYSEQVLERVNELELDVEFT